MSRRPLGRIPSFGPCLHRYTLGFRNIVSEGSLSYSNARGMFTFLPSLVRPKLSVPCMFYHARPTWDMGVTDVAGYSVCLGSYVRTYSSDKVPYHQLHRILANILTTPSGKNHLGFSSRRTPSRGRLDSGVSLSRLCSQGSRLRQPWCEKSDFSLAPVLVEAIAPDKGLM